METKKTSKKPLKTAEISAVPVTVSEAPVPASKPQKRISASSSKAAVKGSSTTSTTKNSSHRHSKVSGTAVASINYDEVARLAYKYWEERSYAHGFADEDWHRAEKTVRTRG